MKLARGYLFIYCYWIFFTDNVALSEILVSPNMCFQKKAFPLFFTISTWSNYLPVNNDNYCHKMDPRINVGVQIYYCHWKKIVVGHCTRFRKRRILSLKRF